MAHDVLSRGRMNRDETFLGVLVGLACLACSACGAAPASGDVESEVVAVRDSVEATALELDIEGALLSSVAADPRGGFWSFGTVSTAGVSRVLFVHVDGDRARDVTPDDFLVAFACPPGWSAGVASIDAASFAPSGRGMLVGRGSCDSGDGRGASYPFVVEYDGQRFRQLALEDLPLEGAFHPRDVSCTEDTCVVLANRVPLAVTTLEDTSITLLARRGGGWSTLYDERETDMDRLFDPRALVRRADDFVIGGIAVSDGRQRGLVRTRRAGTWTRLETDASLLQAARGSAADEVVFVGGEGPMGSSVAVRVGDEDVREILREPPGVRILAGALLSGSPLLGGEAEESGGLVPYLSVAGLRIPLPPCGAGVVTAIAADGTTALAVGQRATETEHGKRKKPLLVPVSKRRLGESERRLAGFAT